MGKHIKELKAIMAQAEDRGITVPQDYKKKSFCVPRLEKDSIYLNMDEIDRVFKAQVSAQLEKVKDVFVIACLTGQRIGDWHQLSPENVVPVATSKGEMRDLLKVVQEKGGNTVYIPIHPLVRLIWRKHNGLPELLSDQKFNRHIKEVCKAAALGKETVDGKHEEKYLHVSSHTARRSFATNAFLAGMDTLSIRKITGHKSESSFLKYIRLSGQEHGAKAGEHSFFTEAIMQAA